MILHICGNLGAGKTTTAEAVRQRLGWPMVPVGRIRNVLCDERRLWNDAVPRLWRAWDTPSGVPGRSGIWVSTGFNMRELVALERDAPHYLCRVWLTAPPAVLQARLAARSEAPEGYWPYLEDAELLQEVLMRYDTGQKPLPWPVDLRINTAEVPVDAVVAQVLALAARPWNDQLTD